MKSQFKQLFKASVISPLSITPIVFIFGVINYIYLYLKEYHVNIFDYNLSKILATMLVGSIIALIGVLIFMLPTYYVSQKLNLNSYKLYVFIGAVGGSMLGLPSLFSSFDFLPALIFMLFGIVVSFTFWYIAEKRL